MVNQYSKADRLIYNTLEIVQSLCIVTNNIDKVILRLLWPK